MASVQFSPLFSSTYTKLPQPQFKLLRCQKPLLVRCSVGNSSSQGDGFDAKAFRQKFTRSEKYTRFGNKKESSMTMNEEFKSDIIETLKKKENKNEYTWENVTVKLAEAAGFCWGVDYAVAKAFF